MLSKISAFFERHLQPASGVLNSLTQQQKQLASAALLIEVAMADHRFDQSELHSLQQLLSRQFSLNSEQLSDLIELAKDKSANATSLHQFTQLIHQHCSHAEKFDLMVALWEMAYADDQLDKYEEYIIRKVADLIYVPHAEFIRAKNIVKKRLTND